MSVNNDYGQLFCEAVDTIVQLRLSTINFDITKICVITSDSLASNGKYRVKVVDGLSEFDAYTSDISLKKNDIVYVLVPAGDMNELKFIIAKKTDDSNLPLSYKPPFDFFINITGNLVSNPERSKAGLIANESKSATKEWAEEKIIWSYNNENYQNINDLGEPLSKYSVLGILALFRSWLGDLQAIKGSYGLKLRVEAEKEDIADIENDKPELSMDNSLVYYDFILDSSDMVGNAYNFDSYYQQEKTFDIKDIYQIHRMELLFYQKKDFYNQYGELIEVLPDPNLFVKDINICFGYDVSEFDTDKAVIFTSNSPKYSTTADPSESNHKKLELRWIHKDKDGKIFIVPEDNDMDYKILWYKYRLGTYSHTAKAGADWALMSVLYSDLRFNAINPNDPEWADPDAMRDGVKNKYNILDEEWIEYNLSAEPGYYRLPGENYTWLMPDITLAEESIKLIISYLEESGKEDTRKYLVSNTLTFTNREEVVSKPTVDAVTALSIYCEDASNGNYLIYDQGNNLLDLSIGSQEKVLTAWFKGAPLTNAEYIEWIIPKSNSMITIDPLYLGANFTEEILNKKEFRDKTNNAESNEDGKYHIFRFGDSTNKYDISFANTLSYKIKSSYIPGYNDNTILCRVVKDKITYTATKQFLFGPSGTSGSDHTLIINFDESNVNAVEVGSPKTYYNLRARLYTYEGKEVDFDTVNDYELIWEWYLPLVKYNGFNTLQNHYEEGQQATGAAIKNYRKALIVNKNLDLDELHILQVTLKWRGNLNLIAYFPVPLKQHIEQEKEGFKEEYGYISGTDKIIYLSDGNPYYIRLPYRIFKNFYGRPTADELLPEDAWIKTNTTELIDGITWSILYSDTEEKTKKYCPVLKEDILYPVPLYIEDLPMCGILAKLNGKVIWTQPILVLMNRYPNGAINRWDGEGLEIDEENGTIIGTAFAAGRKESDNTFSGVMLGDWKKGAKGDVEDSIGSMTGVYGLHHGEVSYAFKENGTAFIGKSGKGRIYFDGDKGSIYSGNYKIAESGEVGNGMLIDLNDGYIDAYNFRLTSYALLIDSGIEFNEDGSIKGYNGTKFKFNLDDHGSSYFRITADGKNVLEISPTKYMLESTNGNMSIDLNDGYIQADTFTLKAGTGSNIITIDSKAKTYPLKIASKFKVAWDGSLYANSAFLSGIFLSDNGLIGGWFIGKETLEGGGTYVIEKDDDGNITGEVINKGGSKIILDSKKSSIAGGILKSTDNLPIFLDGTLTVSSGQDSYNANYSNEYGYMGAIGSNMGTAIDTNVGIGLWAENSVVKATNSNVGMSYNNSSFSINTTKAEINHGYSIIVGTSTKGTGITFTAPAANLYGIYARFA